MCGIVGVISKSKGGLFKTHIPLIKQMLFADQLRGTDGTGVFFNTHKGIRTYKKPHWASQVIMSDKFDKEMDIAVAEGNYIIGHNRAATKGNLTWENTHPFNRNHITLVHNGTLLGHDELGTKAVVDSNAICIYMAQHGYVETLKKIRGAFALVWADEKEGTLNLCRNDQRPLFLLESNTAWIISSEAELGQWIGARNNYPITKVIPITAGVKFTFCLDDLTKYTEEKVGFYTWATYSRDSLDWGDYNEGYAGYPPVLPASSSNHPQQAVALLKTVPMTKPTGTVIKFKPINVGKNRDAILFDVERQRHFVFCRPEPDERNVTVRIYGHMDMLNKWKKEEILYGSIVLIARLGVGITYHVTGVHVPTNEKEIEIKCKFCDCEISKEALNRSEKRGDDYYCPECSKELQNFGWLNGC